MNSVIKRQKNAKTVLYSENCNYNGNLFEHIDSRQEFYFCRCREEFVGYNCEIPYSLYQNTQEKLLDLLKQIEQKFMHNKDYSRDLLLDALIQMNNFKLSQAVLHKVIEMAHNFLRMENKKENKLKLYLVFDALFTNIFDLLEDLRKENKIMQYSID